MPLFGFDQGFEVYDTSVIQERAPVHWNPTSDLMTDKLLAYLDGPLAQRPAGQPWFIWAYYGDPHAGYLSHEGMPSFGPEIWDLYDQEIAFTDHHLGRLFEGLRQRDEFHNTVILLTADHGEGLDPSKPDNHGLQYHGQTLYDNLVKVPLIISGPTFKPRVVQTPVGHLDVFPTLASLASAPIPASEPPRQGVSLLPYLKGQDPEHPPLFAEKTTTEAVPQKSILRWPYKLIWKIGLNRYELYNLAQDPTEQRPLDEPETLKRLQDELLLWRASTLREIPARGEY
jgi:arylsulfatase A-like enzyme